MDPRDAKRWDVFERLANDASASESERTQAAARLAELRAKYPQGKPAGTPEATPFGYRWSTVDPFVHGGGFRYYSSSTYTEPPGVKAAREESIRKAAVKQQRQQVERIPDWRAVGALHELHRSESAWTDDDKRRCKDVSRPQWARVPVVQATLFARLSVLCGQLLDDYARAQLAGILKTAGEGMIAAGYARWLDSRGV